MFVLEIKLKSNYAPEYQFVTYKTKNLCWRCGYINVMYFVKVKRAINHLSIEKHWKEFLQY